MQQDTPLEQRESCLSIRAAFDPFHFSDETYQHAITHRLGATIGDSFCIIGQRARQKRSVLQSHWPGQRLSIAPDATAPRACASLQPKSCASVNTTAIVESLWTRCSR